MLFSGYPLSFYIYLIPAILISITFHELSHGFVSYKLGDPTAKNLGRLTLNPLKHLDILGTLMMLLSGFGWAKPVPINTTYYKDKRKGTILVSLAGPLSNILLALIFAFPMIYLENTFGLQHGSLYKGVDIRVIIYNFCFIAYFINIRLAVFNIIPIPPLDGSRLLTVLLPQRQYFKMQQYENYIGLGFLVLIFMLPGVLNTIMSPFLWVVETGIGFIVNPILKLFS